MKQGYNDRLDDSLGMRHKGMHEQDWKDRRDESKGMSEEMRLRPYAGDEMMDHPNAKSSKSYPMH